MSPSPIQHLRHPLSLSFLWLALLLSLPRPESFAATPQHIPVAGLTTVYRHNSHSDVILSRLLLTDMLDGTGKESPLRLVSLYTDQRPPNDISRLLAASHRFPIYSNISGALTLGSGKLAVKGVLLIAEHGDYPKSSTGNTQYPKRRFWEETLEVFRSSGKVVPVFIDKHLADNWTDAKYIYDSALQLKIPLLAGSSVPGSWRHPAADVERDAELIEIVMLSFGSTDHYGFHALECLQALAEQRKNSETGVRWVQCTTGETVWKALENRTIDRELFRVAMGRQSHHPSPELSTLKAQVPSPVLWQIEYLDGLKASVVELNGAVREWSGSWRYKHRPGRTIESTQFWTQEARPAAHFTLLLHDIEQMLIQGKSHRSVERTLMTSGLLDALLQSCSAGGGRIETPHLQFRYKTEWRWHQPPPPPPSRPWGEQ